MTQVTTAAAAAILGVSGRRVRQFATDGTLPYILTPLGRLFERTAVEQLREQREGRRGR